MDHLDAVFCVPVTTEVQSVTERLVYVPIAKWVPMGIAVICVQTMCRGLNVLDVNLASGGCQRMAVKVGTLGLRHQLICCEVALLPPF